jgi:hypothetical protein
MTLLASAIGHDAEHNGGWPHDQGSDMAIRRDDEVNRNIDTETAEGHRRTPFLEESGDAGKKALVRPADGLDDEAEGHRRMP